MKAKNSPLLKNILLFLIIFLAIAGLFSTYNLQTDKPEIKDIGTLVNQIELGQIKKIEIQDNKLSVTLNDDTTEEVSKEPQDSLTTLLSNYAVNPEKIKTIQIEVKEESGFSYWLKTLLPFLIPFIFIGIFIYIMTRQIQGANTRAMSFGKSGAREIAKNSKNKITFKDVAGEKEAKEELQEVVEFLKHPKKFISVGAKIPKGVLLMGSPGTGKTLLARAVSGEAEVPFFHISGSEFVEMFVGVGASRVRDLFAKAKKNTPCIIFVDEIDAVGRQRGTGMGGSHDEREQTLNQILVEMDGFDPNQGIIVMAATNRPDVLDPALLRPGRFDRRIVLDMPDIIDRAEILKIHAKGKPIAKNVDIKRIAERTPGFSGADLANLMNEAAILTARRNKKEMTMDELTEAIEKVMLGPERKSRVLSKEEKEITAYHEAGHALVAHESPYSDLVHKISIISRGHAAGYTLKLPEKERYLKTRGEFLAELAVALGGYATEKMIFGESDLTTGASNDLRVATRLARTMVTQYGMSEKLGPRTYGHKEDVVFLGRDFTEQKDYSETTAQVIDEEITHLMKEAEKKAHEIISKNKEKLKEIVDILLKQEIIEKEEFESLFKK
ncbi:MAG: cell division protein FtsH [Parcubacteria group bacterium CG10_big_fil_rev_8_21_14_0_10_36_14]|nr:MAG: cell division protein FtsH [Parcubacteria group bacterium CG10_big_fil_rev_8_21_14_0_10_36_14]